MLSSIPSIIFGVSLVMTCVVGSLMAHRFFVYSRSLTITLLSVGVFSVGAVILLIALYALLFI